MAVDTAREPQTKGTALIDLVKMARRERAAFEKTLPPETRAFLDTRVLVAAWYPEKHLRDLLIALDRLHGKGDLALCRHYGRLSAEKDLRGVYRSLAVASDPAATLEVFPTIWSLYHDTGTVVFESLVGGGAELKVRGFGLPSAALCASTEGWILEAAVGVGGQSVLAKEVTCRNRADPVCTYRVSWAVSPTPAARRGAGEASPPTS